MAQITISDELLGRIDSVRSRSVSTEEFVADAVREKLAWQERKSEFCQLSDATRQMMDEKGISESQILAVRSLLADATRRPSGLQATA